MITLLIILIVVYFVGVGATSIATQGYITFTWPVYWFKRIKDRND